MFCGAQPAAACAISPDHCVSPPLVILPHTRPILHGSGKRSRLLIRVGRRSLALVSVPLALHAISAKLSQATDRGASATTPAVEQNQKRLDTLVEAMRTFQPQYYGTHWVSETVRYAVKLAQSAGRSSLHPPASGTPPVTDWVQLLHTDQALYLRIIITVDLCISKSKLPEELDYPIPLRSFSQSTQSTSGRLLLRQRDEDANSRPSPRTHVSPDTRHPPPGARRESREAAARASSGSRGSPGSWQDAHMLDMLDMDLRTPIPTAAGQAALTTSRSGTGNHNLADASAPAHDDHDYFVDVGDMDFSGLGFGDMDPRIFDHHGGGLGAGLGGGGPSGGVFCSPQNGEADLSEVQSVREWLTISGHF